MAILALTMGPSLGITMLPASLRVGEPGTITFEAVGAVGSVTWRIVSSSLPAEWDSSLTPSGTTATLDTAEAEVFGTFMVTIIASDENRHPVTRTFVILVVPAPVTIASPPGEYSWIVGTAVSVNLAITGGTGVYVSAIVSSGAMPGGITVGISGSNLTLTGTPTGVMTGSASIVVTDSDGAQGIVWIDYEVKALPKILIAGVQLSSVNGVSIPNFARLNYDGTTDTSFALPTVGGGVISHCHVSPNGMIYIGGSFTSVNGVTQRRIARLHPDGALDASFTSPFGSSGVTYIRITEQADGKVLVISGDVYRLSTSGAIEITIPYPAGACYTVLQLADGSYLTGGTVSGATAYNAFAHYFADGTRDTSFAPTIAGANRQVRGIAVQSDGKILVVGDFTSISGVGAGDMARLNADFTHDPSFYAWARYNIVIAVHDSAYGSGGVYVFGNDEYWSGSTYVSRKVARLDSATGFPGSFSPNISFSFGSIGVAALVENPVTGEVIVGGNYNMLNTGDRTRYMAMLARNGSVIAGFDPVFAYNSASQVVESVQLQWPPT